MSKYPDTTVYAAAGASRETVLADAPLFLPLLDAHPSLILFTRSTPGFEKVRQVFNANIAMQPLVIASPRTEAEVSATISFCSSHSPRMPLAIRSGGHDMWGRSLVQDGVVVDLRNINYVKISEDKTSARIGGGIMGGQLLEHIEKLGYTTPTGFCTGVGYAGWSLNGGYGVLEGKYGLGCDQILAARVVTATGEVVDTKDDPELLWALRGAGNGNFGAVVELTIKIYPQPAMLGGRLVFSLTEVQSVFTNLHQLLVEEFPDEYSGDFLCAYVPGLGPIITLLYTWVQDGKDLTRARAHLEKVQAVGKVLLNDVAEITPCNYASSLDFSTRTRLPFHFRTRTIAGITPKLADVLQKNAGLSGATQLIAHNAHGAAIKADPTSCFVNRTPHLVFGIGAGVAPPATGSGPEMREAAQFSDRLADSLKAEGLSMDSAYMNFSPPDECDTLLFYGKETTERLKVMKKKYDPQNVFFKAYPTLV